jgi:hypothetical protein
MTSTAPASMAATATSRRPGLAALPPATAPSAAMPVIVIVSTVVVRSGTAGVPAAAFWIPIETARTTISGYRYAAMTGLPLSAARTTGAAKPVTGRTHSGLVAALAGAIRQPLGSTRDDGG